MRRRIQQSPWRNHQQSITLLFVVGAENSHDISRRKFSIFHTGDTRRKSNMWRCVKGTAPSLGQASNGPIQPPPPSPYQEPSVCQQHTILSASSFPLAPPPACVLCIVPFPALNHVCFYPFSAALLQLCCMGPFDVAAFSTSVHADKQPRTGMAPGTMIRCSHEARGRA